MKGLCKKTEVKSFGLPVLLRHVTSVFADTHMLSAKTIQRILRHKNMMMTEKYIANINPDLDDIENLLGEKSTQEERRKSKKGQE